MAPKRKFRVWRGQGTEGRFEEYEVAVDPGMVVLDVLHRIQAERVNDLAVRWNCISMVAQALNDARACAEIPRGEHDGTEASDWAVDNCLFSIAQHKNDPTVCASIHAADTKEYCERATAVTP